MSFFISTAYAADSTLAVNTSAWNAIASAHIMVQLTIVALIILSVLSWGVILSKCIQFKKLNESNPLFVNFFWRADSLEATYSQLVQHPDSSMSRLFQAGYLELQKMVDSHLVENKENNNTSPPRLSGLDNLERVLRKAADNEISLLEARLSLLATTGSTAPFIGLFGTVWGIMTSFQSIASTGHASLAVVAPGISEALIATAIGLLTAIPAVIGYNNYISKLKKEEIALNNFSADFLNLVKRNFFKGE